MKQLKTISLCFIFFIFMIPFSVPAQGSSPPGVSNVIPVEEVQTFIQEYKNRFMKMDLDAFMALFSKEATENRTLPYEDIREAYRRTIAHSKSIVYQLTIYSIQTTPRQAYVTGHYQITQAFKSGGRKKMFRGDIQWDLIRENGSLKIREVNYGKSR